jgi:hypothetical protein
MPSLLSELEFVPRTYKIVSQRFAISAMPATRLCIILLKFDLAAENES